MEKQFYILLSIKTTNGLDTYGQFSLSNRREAAYDLFDSLKGSKAITDTAMLHMDLMETLNDLPVKIKTVCCTLDEFTCNSKFIAKEVFRMRNLEE